MLGRDCVHWYRRGTCSSCPLLGLSHVDHFMDFTREPGRVVLERNRATRASLQVYDSTLVTPDDTRRPKPLSPSYHS